ncbi:MAG TPA: hypothetical protein PLV65_06070 [Tenuifilaceae bacterium]|nr:hypothetical protein [Tenuifilaceae bacterium]
MIFAKFKLPLTNSEKAADNPVLGVSTPVISVKIDGIGCLPGAYINEYANTPSTTNASNRLTIL